MEEQKIIMTRTLAESRNEGKSISAAKTGKLSSVAKQKGKCAQGDAWSFRHDESERGKFTRSTRPTPQLQTVNGKNLRKEGRSEAAVHLKKEASKTVSVSL